MQALTHGLEDVVGAVWTLVLPALEEVPHTSRQTDARQPRSARGGVSQGYRARARCSLLLLPRRPWRLMAVFDAQGIVAGLQEVFGADLFVLTWLLLNIEALTPRGR